MGMVKKFGRNRDEGLFKTVFYLVLGLLFIFSGIFYSVKESDYLYLYLGFFIGVLFIVGAWLNHLKKSF